MYAVSPMLMCRVLERGESLIREGRWQHQSPPQYSQSSPSLAPIIPRISYVGNLATKKFEKPFGSNLILGCVVVNYMSQPMQGMQQLRVGR